MGFFLSKLNVESHGRNWKVTSPLIFKSSKYGIFEVPAGFISDYASVPRIPLVYALFGNTSHSSAVLHDYLYSSESKVSRRIADEVFLEAMESRKQSAWRRYPMWWAVRLFGWTRYKKG